MNIQNIVTFIFKAIKFIAFLVSAKKNNYPVKSAVVPHVKLKRSTAKTIEIVIEKQFLPINPKTRPGLRLQTPNGVVIHNISQEAGIEHLKFWWSKFELAEIKYGSAQIALEGERVVAFMELGEMAHHCADQIGNLTKRGFELATVKGDSNFSFPPAELRNLLHILAYLAVKENWDMTKQPETMSEAIPIHVLREIPVSLHGHWIPSARGLKSKLPCPYYWLKYPDKFTVFLQDLKSTISRVKSGELKIKTRYSDE